MLPVRPRAILNERQVLQIFQIKLTAKTSMHPCPSAVHTAIYFGISEKTVRDIWTGRTWARETCHMDPSRPASTKKMTGRPKGCKGCRPRTTMQQQNESALLRPTSESMATNNIPNDNRTANETRQLCQEGCVRQQRVSGSVDDQLHEWAEGLSMLPELVDPFLLDWAAEPARGNCDL